MPASSDRRIPDASSTSIIAASRRARKLRPWHARRSAESSPLLNTGTGPGGAFGRPKSRHGVGAVLLGGQPPQEQPHRAELVARVRGAVLAQQPHRPPLQILPVHLPPAGLIRLRDQVRRREPAHRLGIGVQSPPGLALGGQVQPERAHLGLERPRVQRLRMRRAPLPGRRSFTLVPLILAGTGARNAPVDPI